MYMLIPRVYRNGRWENAVGLDASVETNSLPSIDGADITRVDVLLAAQNLPPVSGFCVAVDLPSGLECVWKPHLSPLPDMTVGEKAFRSPAIIMEGEKEILALIPNLDELERPHQQQFLMDWSYDTGLYCGVGPQAETGHVYYRLTEEPMHLTEDLTFSFFLMSAPKQPDVRRDFRPVLNVLWKLFAEPRMAAKPPSAIELLPYARHVYSWAFERWESVCWQSFELNGLKVGGVVFIVTASQKPGLGREDDWREPKSLWNQAWFCSLRSAYGYKLYALRTGDAELSRKAELALNFALSAPREGGLFASYYVAGDDGDWAKGRWVFAAPRHPKGYDAYAHLLDNSWTCYWLLKWHQRIEARPEILAFVSEYVRTLLALQRPDGGYPAWVRPEDADCAPYLTVSPEAAAHMLLLAKLYEIRPDPALLDSMERTAAFLTREILPGGRWEDFETYWSCAAEWAEKRHGQTDPRSGLHSQCTFGMYWVAEAMLALYRICAKPEHLDAGQRALAELSLYQQICSPHGFGVPTLGGFGVMNCDDEWNDARQSLIALTYLRYYQLTGDEQYRLRALWAMKASFYMMYCPENPDVRALYETVHPQFGPTDFGFHMENFNHHDGTCQQGLGEFTIFDWGNGAACASLLDFLLEESESTLLG